MTMTTKQEKSSTDLMAGEKGGGGDVVHNKGVAMGVAGGGKACEEVVPAAGHILHPTTMTCPLPTTNTSIVPVHAVTMSTSGGGLLVGVGKQHSNKNYVRDHGLPSVVEIKNGGGGGGSLPELGTRRASVSSQGYESQGSNSNHQNSDGGYCAFGALVSAFAVAAGIGGGGGDNNNNNNYVAGQQQNFLDGHFAGGWQSNANLPDRRRMNFHIIKVIELMRPDANRLSQNRLILMAKKLEDHLYRSAYTKEEYVDLVSLKRRLHLIAKANSIAGFNDGGEDGSNVSLAGSTGVLHIAGAGMIFNQNASTIKAMARTSWLQERHQQHNSVASFTDRQKQSNTSQNSISTMSRLLPHDSSINSKDKLQRQEKKKLVLLDRIEVAVTTAPAIVSKTGSSGDKSIPQLIGITLQSSQTCPRDDNCVPQQHAQQSLMMGMQPQTDDGNLRILQIELRKKQLTLTQVQQQMDNLFGQTKKLQHQLSMSASNLQQAQQLQQQETILGQLNHQYEQQQLILQSEIMHHMFLIQQYEQRNALSTVSNVTISSKRYKNGNEVDESHISKKTKPLSVAEQCLPILKKLINHEHGWVFKDPVDPVELGLLDYFDIVKHPMDLNLVMKKLECGSYTDIKSFECDTKLIFTNAILFNGDESDVGCMAKELLDILVVDLKGDKYRKPAM